MIENTPQNTYLVGGIFMLFVFTIWVIAAILAGVIASNKNRSVGGWVIGSILLTPLIILILLALPKIENYYEQKQKVEGKSIAGIVVDENLSIYKEVAFCPKCGIKRYSQNSNFCTGCGTEFY